MIYTDFLILHEANCGHNWHNWLLHPQFERMSNATQSIIGLAFGWFMQPMQHADHVLKVISNLLHRLPCDLGVMCHCLSNWLTHTNAYCRILIQLHSLLALLVCGVQRWSSCSSLCCLAAPLP